MRWQMEAPQKLVSSDRFTPGRMQRIGQGWKNHNDHVYYRPRGWHFSVPPHPLEIPQTSWQYVTDRFKGRPSIVLPLYREAQASPLFFHKSSPGIVFFFSLAHWAPNHSRAATPITHLLAIQTEINYVRCSRDWRFSA